MGKQRESKLSQEIQLALRSQGYFCFKVHGSEYMMAGLPDIIVCAKGVFIGLETKNPDKRDNTSAIQDRVHGKIRQAEGYCSVVTSPTEAIRFVETCILDMFGEAPSINYGHPDEQIEWP